MSFAAVLLLPSLALAEQGFGVSPAFQDVHVGASQPQVVVAVEIGNSSATDQTFRLSAADFGALDESGGVAFSGAPANELDHPYGLASWLKLEKDVLTVRAGDSQQLKVIIQNRASLAPGGHYGAVLATAVTDDGKPAGESRVGVKQVLSSLILAVKEGGTVTDLKLDKATFSAHAWTLPGSVLLRFRNNGNVHVVPRGIMSVRDPLGHEVARAALNDGSNAVLPQSFRRYDTKLVGDGLAWLPGRYRIITTYYPDGSSQQRTSSQSFWFAGAVVVWLVGLVAIAAVGALAWLIVRRRRRIERS